MKAGSRQYGIDERRRTAIGSMVNGTIGGHSKIGMPIVDVRRVPLVAPEETSATVVGLWLAGSRAIPSAPGGYSLIGSEAGAMLTLAVYVGSGDATFTTAGGTTISGGVAARAALDGNVSYGADSAQSTTNPLTLPLPGGSAGNGVVTCILHANPEYAAVDAFDPGDYGSIFIGSQTGPFSEKLDLSVCPRGAESSVDINFQADTEGMAVAVDLGVPLVGFSFPDLSTTGVGGGGLTSWSPTF